MNQEPRCVQRRNAILKKVWSYIGWNFTKFMIDREGKVIARFEPTVDMNEVKAAVIAAL